MKSKETILNYLKETNCSESNLCEVCGTDNNYIFVSSQIDGEALEKFPLGVCVIKCKEGYFSLPVEYIENGCEYLDVDCVTDLSMDDMLHYNALIDSYVKWFKKLITD